MHILIFGYGNTLRSDDALGYLAALTLADEFSSLPAVSVIPCQQLGPEYVEDLHAADLAIFIDADSTTAPGEITCTPVTPQQQDPGSMTHHFPPAVLLGMCQALYGGVPQAYLYSVGAASFDLGESLTPLVQQALPELLEKVRARVKSALTEN